MGAWSLVAQRHSARTTSARPFVCWACASSALATSARSAALGSAFWKKLTACDLARSSPVCRFFRWSANVSAFCGLLSSPANGFPRGKPLGESLARFLSFSLSKSLSLSGLGKSVRFGMSPGNLGMLRSCGIWMLPRASRAFSSSDLPPERRMMAVTPLPISKRPPMTMPTMSPVFEFFC